MTDGTFITRVVLHNYKSIASCDVRLGSLTYLVGPNGCGKSNFLDALHLVRDALLGSLDNALNERGGLSEVRRRSSGHPTHFGIRLEFRLRDGRRVTMPSAWEPCRGAASRSKRNSAQWAPAAKDPRSGWFGDSRSPPAREPFRRSRRIGWPS